MLSTRELADRLSANPGFENPFKITTSKKAKSAKKASADAQRIWDIFLQYYTYQNLPMAYSRLCDMEMGDLRRIASYFKPYCGEEMRQFSKSQLISFIAGYQEDVKRLKKIEPLPFEGLPNVTP
ncbi:MAG: hypothetical protein AABY53_01145 [Bdellovibrionota bacterium]